MQTTIKSSKACLRAGSFQEDHDSIPVRNGGERPTWHILERSLIRRRQIVGSWRCLHRCRGSWFKTKQCADVNTVKVQNKYTHTCKPKICWPEGRAETLGRRRADTHTQPPLQKSLQPAQNSATAATHLSARESQPATL
eukprot:1146914-Pelagomonas_calceolata.AAC.4